jgi:hypothetical protein
MARTFIRQDTQIRNSDVYDDTIAPTLADYETNPTHIEDDLNNQRSMLSYLKDIQAGNWYDTLVVPSTLETGAARGIDNLNSALHLVEKKRVLRCVWNLHSIAGGAGQHVVLAGGELPANTTLAIGAVTTLGTVVATATTFTTASAADVVAGTTAIAPKNLVQIVDATTRDPVLDAGDQIYGLLQSESAVDGSTATATTPNRLQISFVKISGGTSLVLATAGAMNGVNFDFCGVERVRLEDLNEADFLGGANVDVPAGTTVTRQSAYDNQGATPVDLLTNAILDLEAAGIEWQIRDDLEALLFRIVEGSAGGTSEIEIGADVDLYDNNAADVDFASGASINSGGTRPIDVGVNDGIVESTAGDLGIVAAAELLLDDVNQTGSTWAQTTGIKLSETTAEWDAFEVEFGEVSLLNAIVQASNQGGIVKTCANVTVTTVADTDVSLGDGNLDASLGDLSGGNFVDDHDVYLNGSLLRSGANAAANNDVYPGTSLAAGQLRFEFTVKINDVICVISRA